MVQVCLLAWHGSHPQSQTLWAPGAGRLPLDALFEMVDAPWQPFAYRQFNTRARFGWQFECMLCDQILLCKSTAPSHSPQNTDMLQQKYNS